MLESIYGAHSVTQEQSPLAAYLASQAGRKKRTPNPVSDVLNSAQVASRNAMPSTQVDQSGTVTSSAPSAPAADPAAQKAADQAKTGGVGANMAKVDLGDYSSDPALQRILGGNITDAADADASALGARRGVLAQYGDRGLAASVLGADDPTLGAISDDPAASTSTLARLKRAYQATVAQNEDAMNENNLWYGGKRGQRLGDLAKDYETQGADASAAVQAALEQIAGGLASTKQGLRDKASAAEGDAAGRAAQQKLLEILAGGNADGVTPPPPPDDGTGGAPDTGPVNPDDPNLFWDSVKQAWVPAPGRPLPYALAQ